MKLFYYKHQFVPLDKTLELYFSGCSLRCPGCHNSFLQDRTSENTKEVSVGEILCEIEDYVSIASQVHILGGEPLEQDLKALSVLLEELRKKGFKNIILFTGWDIPQSYLKKEWDLFKHCDYIKTGNYDENQLNHSKTLIPDSPPFPLASKNQTFIKVNKSKIEE
jgi:organic radical activating enzyme